MENVHFYFDEAGEKGFLEGVFSNEAFGLIAGIALPARNVAKMNEDLREVFSNLNCDGVEKIHATEIFRNGANQETKEALFEYLSRKDEWLLVYEAMYPQGYMNLKKSQPVPQSMEDPKYKRTKRKNKKRLYNEILRCAIVKLDEICKLEDSTNLQMITDTMDNKLLKEAIAELEYLKQDEHKLVSSAFDTEQNKVVYRTITSKIENPEIPVKNINTIVIEETPSFITLAADIVTNSLYRHLTFKILNNGYIRLHSNEATDGFRIESKIAFRDDRYIMDSLYNPTFSG
ncbi:MAG: hypothetical protein OFPI_00350 [Osedax symbiont Rs2]|nr:MAG: hypothetical protein OFPI_00350 [Osedax symbiont Rs2]